MDLHVIDRRPDAFQQSVTAREIDAIFRRVFGAETCVRAAVELGHGMYNSTYRVDLADRSDPVILRVAPPASRQFSSERALIRNEYASIPYLGVVSPLMPHVIAADFTGEIVNRDYLVQSFLPGLPAPEHLSSYPRSTWPGFFRELGAIARSIHAVEGSRFGPVSGPGHDLWSAAVHASLLAIAEDLDGVGLDAGDLRAAAAIALSGAHVLDQISTPHLLTGDLWTVNVLLDPEAPVPHITGVFDLDRTWWGDPAADWTIRMALAKVDERVAFWESYGQRDQSPQARWRAMVYEARHLGAVRLERHRLGDPDVQGTYDAMSQLLAELS